MTLTTEQTATLKRLSAQQRDILKKRMVTEGRYTDAMDILKYNYKQDRLSIEKERDGKFLEEAEKLL